MIIIQKKVIISLIALAVIWVGNIYYFMQSQLKEPIFMKHYYDLYVHESSNNYFLQLYYLVDRNQKHEIVSVQIPDSNIILNSVSTQRDHYTHQRLNQLNIELNEANLKALFDSGQTSFEQLYAIFDDGSKKSMDIGIIRFHKAQRFDGYKALTEKSSGSSNANAGFRLLVAEEPIEIKGFDYSFKDVLSKSLNISFDTDQERLNQINTELMVTEDPEFRNQLFENTGTSLDKLTFPIRLNKGDLLKVSYDFVFDENKEVTQDNPTAYYRLGGLLTYKTQNGQEYQRELEMHYNPYFTEKEIRGLVREKKGE